MWIWAGSKNNSEFKEKKKNLKYQIWETQNQKNEEKWTEPKEPGGLIKKINICIVRVS